VRAGIEFADFGTHGGVLFSVGFLEVMEEYRGD